MNAFFTTGKSLLNALAFANVNNIDELRSMLDQVDPATRSPEVLTQRKAVLQESGHSSFTPPLGHIQGAL